jgi:hypothetical protein
MTPVLKQIVLGTLTASAIMFMAAVTYQANGSFAAHGGTSLDHLIGKRDGGNR